MSPRIHPYCRRRPAPGLAMEVMRPKRGLLRRLLVTMAAFLRSFARPRKQRHRPFQLEEPPSLKVFKEQKKLYRELLVAGLEEEANEARKKATDSLRKCMDEISIVHE